ncbi:MAG: DoxX family membrane protein [Candidatus Dormibacteraeota bacterium]|nr:DoxX family membrane protein [Candidatus Dormibacteraeota bacterium]MBV9526042.1 DoxX family membrane protein [Candidatus Dormibacteraeota bacterium]
MAGLLRLTARWSLAAIFVTSGIDLIQDPEARTRRAAEALPGMPPIPAIGQVHGAAMAVAGTTFGLGILPVASAAVLAASLVPNTYVGHPFWKEDDPKARKGQRIHFLKNLGLFGGLVFEVLETKARKHR